jgi:membrane protein YdbS with pleckstrin-like domain
MAQKIKRKSDRQTKKIFVSPFSIYWEKSNYYFLAAGIVVVIFGFYFLSIGPWDSFSSLVIAPILLFIGYVLIFPASILYRKKTDQTKPQEDNIAAGKS